MKDRSSSLTHLVFISLLAAMAMVMMLTVGIKILPMASYLKYDPSGSVILLCGLLLGPLAGFQCGFIKNILYFFVHGGSPYGHLSDFIATSTFVFVASFLKKRLKKETLTYMIICCATGGLATTLIMIPLNYVILHLQFGMAPEAVTASLIYIIPFNILKATLNSTLALSLYKPVHRAISKKMAIEK